MRNRAGAALNVAGFVDRVVTMQEEAESSGRALQSVEQRIFIDALVRLAVAVLWCALNCTVLYCHWSKYIKPSPNKYIPVRAIVPDDLKGNWKYGMFECFGELGTCCCFSFFPACMWGDFWYRAGWLHASFDESSNQKFGDKPLDELCPGWLFFLGCFGWCAMNDFVACFTPCVYAAGRSGIAFIDGGDGGLGKIVPMTKRFGLPNAGLSTFITDCCLYCWCSPCAATQEYRQVMALLDRGPVQEESNAPVVMGAVVGANVVGQPVVANTVESNKA